MSMRRKWEHRWNYKEQDPKAQNGFPLARAKEAISLAFALQSTTSNMNEDHVGKLEIIVAIAIVYEVVSKNNKLRRLIG